MREKQPENNDGGHAISSNQPTEGLILSSGGGGESWSFCAAKLGSRWFKHKTESVKQPPESQGIWPTQRSENSKLFSDFAVNLKLTDNFSRLRVLISLLQKPK